MVRRPATLTALALALPLTLALAACGQGTEDSNGPGTSTSKASGTNATPSDEGGMPDIQAPGVAPALDAQPMEAGIPAGKRDNPYPVTTTWRGEGALLEFNVWRMHCEGCASQVRKALKTIDGVESVETDRETDIVKVTLSDAAQRERVIEQAPEALRSATRKKFTVVQP